MFLDHEKLAAIYWRAFVDIGAPIGFLGLLFLWLNSRVG